MAPLGSYLLETLITLLAVCVLAVLVLYAARRAGVGRATGPVELIGRLPLDGRRAVYLVRAGKTVFVLGASEAGLSKLGELEDEAVTTSAEPVQSAPAFRQMLARALERQPAARERSNAG